MAKQFLALLITQDTRGVWWADVDKIQTMPPEFPEVPHCAGSLDGFPKFVRDKLAKLRMVAPSETPIKNLGRRVDEHTFWVYLEYRK